MTINQYASDDSRSDFLYYLLGDRDSEEDKDEEIAMIFMGAAAAADSIYRPSCHGRKAFQGGPIGII